MLKLHFPCNICFITPHSYLLYTKKKKNICTNLTETFGRSSRCYKFGVMSLSTNVKTGHISNALHKHKFLSAFIANIIKKCLKKVGFTEGAKGLTSCTAMTRHSIICGLFHSESKSWRWNRTEAVTSGVKINVVCCFVGWQAAFAEHKEQPLHTCWLRY